MKEDEVRILADHILQPFLAAAGFTSSDVVERPDHDGDDSLFVILHFKPGSEVASGRTYIDAHVAIWDALIARGERRFPYFDYDYPLDPSDVVDPKDDNPQ